MAYLVCAHIFFVMHLWSFLHVMFSSGNKNIPAEYRLTESEHESLLQLPEESQQSILLEHYIQQRNIKIWTRNRANHVRYCIECQQIKPDRAHHCSTCGVCILKMDHHCPWVNNCVGFANQKSFLLTLFYGSLCFILCVVSELQFVVMDIHRVEYDLPLYFILSGFIVITLLGFCMGFLYFQHVDLLLKNVTIIEDVQTVTFVHDRLTFDLGPGLNCTEVLGEWIFEWLFPTISATGDGTTFEVRYK